MVDYSAWAYRDIKLKVTNPSSTANVQAKFIFNVPYGMSSDGKDMRFADHDGNALSYYIQSITSGVATVWVKLPANDTYIYLYYGNSSATSESSGDNTFEFFDNFTTFDLTKWTFAGSPTITDGVLEIYNSSADCRASSNTSFGSCILEYSAKYFNTGYISGGFWSNITFLYNGALMATRWMGAEYQTQLLTFSNDYHVYRIDRFAGANKYYIDGVLQITSSITYTDPLDSLAVLFWNSGSGEGKIDVDWVFVRKYVAVEPTINFDYSDWSKTYNPIIITNPSTTSGVQAELKLSRLMLMDDAGADIRFSDVDGNKIPYYIESLIDNVFTIWVKLPADLTTIYFHYGNSSATSESDGDSVFELFDDFSGSTVDTVKWTPVGSVTVASGIATILRTGGNNAYIRSVSTINSTSRVIIKLKTAHYLNLSYSEAVRLYYDGSNFCFAAISWNSAGQCGKFENIAGGTPSYSDIPVWPAFQYNVLEIDRKSTTKIVYKVNGASTEIATNVFSQNAYLYIYASNADNSKVEVDHIYVCSSVTTLPTLDVVYDISDLEPISIDVTKNINSAFHSLTAVFPNKYVPVKGSKVCLYVSGSDVTDYLFFYGRVKDVRKKISSTGGECELYAVDDMAALSQIRMPWDCTSDPGAISYDLTSWMNVLCMNIQITPGNVYSSAVDFYPDLDTKATLYDMIKKILEYYSVIYTTSFTGFREYIQITKPETIDDVSSGFNLPTPVEFTWPDSTIVNNPEISVREDEDFNKVTVFGVLSNTDANTVSSACKISVYDSEDPDEYTYEDNLIYEKSSTAQIEAIKWLLYYSVKKATVKVKFKNRLGFELYQRIKFGTGFDDELVNLTSAEPINQIYVYDPSTIDSKEKIIDVSDFTPIDTSGVPMPSWLRITGIKYHKNLADEYLEVEALTDWIYSSSDPVISAPYSTYLNPGNRKPVTEDITTIVESIIEKTVNGKPFIEYGTVSSVAGDGKTAVVTTDSGRARTVKTVSATTIGKRVIVIPDGKGKYYLGAYG